MFNNTIFYNSLTFVWHIFRYPVILSIEDHCSIPQQKKMAELFTSVFGNMLLSSPVVPGETKMPSPEQLKYKIIIKHNKLGKGNDENTCFAAAEDGDYY